MGFQWEELRSIGIDEIDTRHKEPLQRFNELLSVCKSGQGSEEFASFLTYIEEYVVKHFRANKSMHFGQGHMNYWERQKEHDCFIERLHAIKDEIDLEGVDIRHLMEVNNILFRWLLNHSSISDKNIGTYLRSFV